MNKEVFIYFFLILLLPTYSFAQNDTVPVIITDRPTAAVGSYIVPKGAFQIETGVIYTNRNDQVDRKELWSYATTLFRYGVLNNLEVRLAGSYESSEVYVKETQADSSYSGMGPLTAGFKITVVHEKGIRPEIAINASITFRHVGHESYSPTYSYPVGLLTATHTLSKRFIFGYNIGFAYNGENGDGFFIYAGYLGFQITDRLWSFVEIFGDFDNGNFPNHKLDGGLTYRIRNNLQIDVSGGKGLTPDINLYFLNAGIAWRIPR